MPPYLIYNITTFPHPLSSSNIGLYMGCFLGCFGLSNKRKRRKTLYKVLAVAAHQKCGNYEALDSSVTAKVSIAEKPIVPYSDSREGDKCKENTCVKTRKKVRFNLNVEIYEPNPTAYQILDNEQEGNEKNSEETEERSSPSSIMGEGSAALTMGYPSDYRYYNCRDDGCREEDEIVYEESDLDAYDDDDDKFSDDWDDGDCDGREDNNEVEAYEQNTRQKELYEPFYSSMADDRIKNQLPLPPNDSELKLNLSGRDRSTYMHSVLSPVENLTQWKAIKAKVTSRRKDNVPLEQMTNMPLVSETSLNFSPYSLELNVLQSKPLLPEIAVDASLSNWLISPNSNVSKTTIHCQ